MTGTELIQRLMQDDVALGRALVVLRNRQTTDEVYAEQSRHLNDRGFRPQHAKMGTSMASYFERFGALTAKQANWWRVRGKEGSRIAIYWKQLLSEFYQGHLDLSFNPEVISVKPVRMVCSNTTQWQVDLDHEIALQMWIDEDYVTAKGMFLLDA